MERREVEHCGVTFLESVYPSWTPGHDDGKIIWEIPGESAALSTCFDPRKPKAVDQARRQLAVFVKQIHQVATEPAD